MYISADQTMPMEGAILFLACSQSLDVFFGNDFPRTFVRDEQHFEDLDDRDFNGFYDFLRDDSRRVLGVRFLPSAPPEFLLDSLKSLPYVERGLSTELRIFFSQERKFDPSISVDQYFGENRIYCSTTGRIALSFSLAPLNVSEVRSIPLTTPPPTALTPQ